MRIMRNKIVRNLLIFLSTLAMMTAVPLTATSVWADGSGGGGTGISGGSSGGAAGATETWYSGDDGGYRIFLVPSNKFMNYRDIESVDSYANRELQFKAGGKYYANDDWLSMTGNKPATRYSKNLEQALEYYKSIKSYSLLGAYDITSDTNAVFYPYAKGSGYQSHYGANLRKQMMGSAYGRTMSFREIFGDSDNLRINNSFSGGTDYENGSGAVTNWGNKMFKFPNNLAKYENRVQQIKNWMKRLGRNYYVSQYGERVGGKSYDMVMSTPNDELDIIIEPLILPHDFAYGWSQCVVYSWMDVLIATKSGEGLGVSNINAEPYSAASYWYHQMKDFGSQVTPSYMIQFGLWDDFTLDKYNNSYINTYHKRYRTTTNCETFKHLVRQNGNYAPRYVKVDAFRQGFVHYTPYNSDEPTVKMGVSHNIVVIDKSDTMGTRNNSSDGKANIDASDIVVTYGGSTVASEADSSRNSLKSGAIAYNNLDVKQYLRAEGGGKEDVDAMKAFKTINGINKNTRTNTATGKKIKLDVDTFSRTVYTGMGTKYYKNLGAYAVLSKIRDDGKNYYNKLIAEKGGITWRGASTKLRNYAADWFYGNTTAQYYGEFLYAGLAGMQKSEWDEAIASNKYDIVLVSTAEIEHNGLKKGQTYPYNLLTVGGSTGRGYMGEGIRKLNNNFYKTVTKTTLTKSNTSSTDVMGAEVKNNLKYAVSKSDNTNDSTLYNRGLSCIFAYELVKSRNNKYAKDFTALASDVRVGKDINENSSVDAINYLGKRIIPTAEGSAEMSKDDEKAYEYKRNFLYNLWDLSAASSKMDVLKTKGTLRITPTKNSAETVTVAVLQKKKTVTSYLALARLSCTANDEEGRNLTYSLANTNSGMYRTYSVASFGKFKITPGEGKGAIMTEVAKQGKTYHYLLSWKSNQTPTSSSYDFKKSSRDAVAKAIGSALADYANSNGGLGNGGYDTEYKLRYFYEHVLGIDSVRVTEKNNKDAIAVATGACEDDEGNLDGYSNLIISWDSYTKPEVSMDGLRPHELNVLLPDLLGFKHVYGNNKNHHYANTYSTADEIHPIPTVVIDVKWHHWFENGDVTNVGANHTCVDSWQVDVDDYKSEWVPYTYDKNHNITGGGYYRQVKVGSHKEWRYAYYHTYEYKWVHSRGDQVDRWDYNQVVPYQIWDKFEGDGIAQNIPDGKNTAFFYYNYKNTGLFRQRKNEHSTTFSAGTSTVPSYLYSLSRRVWNDMVVGCNFVGSLSTDNNNSHSYGEYRRFLTRTVGLNYGNKPSGNSYIDNHVGKKGAIAENNTQKAVEKRYDTITFEIVPNREKVNEGGDNTASYPNGTFSIPSTCGYCGYTYTSTGPTYYGMRGDTESEHRRFTGGGWEDESLVKGFRINGGVVNTEAKYTVYHYMTKYNSKTKPFGTIGVENRIHKGEVGTNKFEWSVLFEEESEKGLHIYPEVEMRLYYANDDSGSATTEVVNNTYSMGEKERDFAPTSLRLVNLRGEDDSFFNGTNYRKFLTASFTSDTIAQSGDALTLRNEHRTDDGRSLPVIYAGGNYNLNINNRFNIDVISYSLDIEDTHNGVTIKGGDAGFDSRNDEWNATKIYQAHLQTVTSIINGLELSMKLQTTTGYSDKFVSSPVKTYNDLKIVGTKIKTPKTESKQVFHLKFKEGAYLENGTGKYTLEGLKPLIQDVAKEYNISESEARSVVENSGIVKSVKMALESRFDADNKSTVEKGFHEGNKWYDEECSVIIVRKQKSKINLGDVVVTDKIDLTAGPKRTSGERTEFFQNSYNAAFYYYLKLKPAEINTPDDAADKNSLYWKLGNGSYLDVSKYKTIIDAYHIKDGDFLIPTATTSDMRNNI